MSTVTSPDSTVIDYDQYGDGPAVIFIGGATAYRAIDEGTTQTARRLVAERYTAIDYDRRGRGRSGDTQPWALEREAEDVESLDLKRAKKLMDVIGHGFRRLERIDHHD